MRQLLNNTEKINKNIINDVSEGQKNETNCLDEQLETMLNTTLDGVVIHQNGRILEVNQTWVELFGYEQSEVINKSVWDFVNDSSKEKIMCNIRSNAQKPYKVAGIKKDGTKVSFEVIGKEFPYKGMDNVRFASFRDITMRERHEKIIKHMAYHDDLTGLANRTLFQRCLTFALANAQRKSHMVGVMFLDLDRFKQINDTLGHSVGDHLLKAVAKRLDKEVPKVSLSARIGGDEFTLLIPEITDEEEVKHVANKVLEVFEKSFQVEGYELNTSASVGISLYPVHGDNVESLIKNADAAMYEAKKQGKSVYRFYRPELNKKLLNQLTLENELRHALDKGQFFLNYQPQVDLKTGEVTGMETLIRWNHPELGVVSPGEFIPIAETTGLIIPIGEWVLRTACAQNKAWQDANHNPIPISVNLSIMQFQESDLVNKVKAILQETKLDPQYLELEITENVFMSNKNRANRILQELRTMGVTVSIDDFGTGFSSLQYLKTIPVDKLKIDKVFVDDITKDEKNEAIIKSIITMAHSLDLQVVSEGVETFKQWHFLKKENCDQMQGFLFEKPMTSDDFSKFLESGKQFKVSL